MKSVSERLSKGEIVFENIDAADFGNRRSNKAKVTNESVSFVDGNQELPEEEFEYEERPTEGLKDNIPGRGFLSGVSSYVYNKLFGINLPPEDYLK